ADAGPDVGDVVPDLRARARAVDDSAQPRRAGLDPRDVRGAAAARQPPARPPGAPRRRVLGAQPAGTAEPGAGAGRLADPVHRGLRARVRGLPLRILFDRPKTRRWRNG